MLPVSMLAEHAMIDYLGHVVLTLHPPQKKIARLQTP